LPVRAGTGQAEPSLLLVRPGSKGQYPVDAELGVVDLESTPGVRRREAVVGSEMPFVEPYCGARSRPPQLRLIPRSTAWSSIWPPTGAFINKREDALFLGPGGTGKSHLAQAIGQAAIQQGYRVLYRETHVLLDELADAIVDGTRKEYMESVATVPLLIIDDFGMRKLPHTAAEDLLEIIMRRYERFSTLLTSNRPVEDWGKLLGDVAAVSAMLDRLLHHGHMLKCGPRSWRTKAASASGQ